MSSNFNTHGARLDGAIDSTTPASTGGRIRDQITGALSGHGKRIDDFSQRIDAIEARMGVLAGDLSAIHKDVSRQLDSTATTALQAKIQDLQHRVDSICEFQDHNYANLEGHVTDLHENVKALKSDSLAASVKLGFLADEHKELSDQLDGVLAIAPILAPTTPAPQEIPTTPLANSTTSSHRSPLPQRLSSAGGFPVGVTTRLVPRVQQ